MPKTIQYFMWPYQDLFRVVRNGRAKRLFSQLSKGLDPELFVVGFLAEDRDDRYPICVEPEDDFWLKPVDLVGVLHDAEVLRASFPEAQMIQSHPEAARRFAKRLDGKALRDALVAFLNNYSKRPADSTFFASHPERVEGFEVLVVVGLNRRTIESYPRLETDKIWIHDHQSQEIPCSLIESAVEAFLEDCGRELRQPEPGPAGMGNSISEQRLLQDAAKRMVTGLAMRTDTFSNTLGAYEISFENFCRIAAMGYEKAEATGRLALARRNHPALSTVIEFVDAVPLQHHRHARKLLEVSRAKSLSLHTNSADCWGFVKIDGNLIEMEDMFEIVFLRRFVWQCLFRDQLLFVIDNGNPSLSHPQIDRDKLGEDIRRVMPMVDAHSTKRIIDLISIAADQEHGTVVVVSSEAASEAIRLRKESTAVNPVELDPETMLSVTAIDGAVILDIDGRCHAIGAILDGVATDGGDPSRGARYNSIIRYLASRKTPAIGVIISEDGSVDIVPKLRPAIYRSEIDQRLDDLRTIAEMGTVPRRYNELVNWFDDYRFYLLQVDCDYLNQLVPTIESTRSNQTEAEIRIVRSKWVPNASMREDWFYKRDDEKV